ncbi:sugar phosphate isomerase/epimerase family protein [Desulfurispira natronophila]|uniref:Sugar phosphate isomerase/epimerase n=1 Tax=Desulfurispira natronophila TaxID=682562 RepID=A0A7W7Y4X6_9BACT|nr:sugar phosphate isomerase/epimerase [Desulfurispira natronophila]MBB5022168.1 sugar phosphate isomerase/epimerase [Desulfurispira natronophila]
MDIRTCALARRAYLFVLMEDPQHYPESPNGYEVLIDSDSLDRYQEDEIIAALKALGQRCQFLTFHAPFYDLNPGGLDSAVRQVSRERWLSTARIAHGVQPRTIVLHTGYSVAMYGRGFLYDHWREQTMESLSQLLSATGESTRLCVENVFEPDPVPLLDVVDGLNHPRLGYCLDVGHSRLFGDTGQRQWIDAMAKRLFELHLHDNHGEADDHLPCGQGTIDYAEILDTLQQHHLNPLLTFEVADQDAFEEAVQFLEHYPD